MDNRFILERGHEVTYLILRYWETLKDMGYVSQSGDFSLVDAYNMAWNLDNAT